MERVVELSPDLVLMDVAMPGMNGLDATRELKSRPGAPRVVILTFYDTPEIRAAAKTAGADAFLVKWALEDELERLLETISAGGS